MEWFYVSVDAEKLELLNFHVQVVSQLTLLCQEVSLISVVKSKLVLGQRSAEDILEPESESFVTY